MCKGKRVQLLHEREMKTRESARVQRDNQTVEAKHSWRCALANACFLEPNPSSLLDLEISQIETVAAVTSVPVAPQ
jgi:hypothetical protein